MNMFMNFYWQLFEIIWEFIYIKDLLVVFKMGNKKLKILNIWKKIIMCMFYDLKINVCTCLSDDKIYFAVTSIVQGWVWYYVCNVLLSGYNIWRKRDTYVIENATTDTTTWCAWILTLHSFVVYTFTLSPCYTLYNLHTYIEYKYIDIKSMNVLFPFSFSCPDTSGLLNGWTNAHGFNALVSCRCIYKDMHNKVFLFGCWAYGDSSI